MIVYWLVLAAAITTSLVGQILLKSGASDSVAASAGFIDQLFRWPTIIGLAAMAVRRCSTSSPSARSR